MLKSFLRYLRLWIPLAALTGVMGGSASALLLFSLSRVTALREMHPWLIALLPLGGLGVGLLYHSFGGSVERGNDMVLDEIYYEGRSARAAIPLRMAPLILIGTCITHLFGGSAGREGTAIQMGASLADQLGRLFRITNTDRRLLLMAGISAGFGSVFGTPLAGAVFGLEVLALGSVTYAAIFPCVLAALVGDLATRAWRIHHTAYQVSAIPPVTFTRLCLAALAGIVFGVCAMSFARVSHSLSRAFKRAIPYAPLRPCVGGVVVALAVVASGTTRFIGLGIPTIQAAFSGVRPWWDWAAKFGFTVVTLGSGFKGGEVTPLFFIGATLGNALSHGLPLPASLLAGMGFVAVFAGAANTPIASTIMAMELFGAEVGVYAGIACVFSYLSSGSYGIYKTQRVGLGKFLRR